MTFAEKLKHARLHLGITQVEAAAVCQVSPRAYWNWEAGKSTLEVTIEGALDRLHARLPRQSSLNTKPRKPSKK